MNYFIFRSSNFWDVIVPNMSDQEWLSNFRVPKSNFEELLNLLSADISPGKVTLL